MKIILCGPPHSGKTVFGNSLYLSLPQGYTAMIRACPDGESLYSSNTDQKLIQLVRKKGVFSKNFVNYVLERVKNEEAPITLIDVGGKRTIENERIFELADGCIILSSDEKEKEEWRKFADKFGLKIIAVLDSSLEGSDVVRAKEPYIDGVITNLERGTIKKGTQLFELIRNSIVEMTITQGMEIRGSECLKDTETIDMRIVARELDMMGREGNIRWDNKRIGEIRDFLNGALKGRNVAKIFECRAIWMTALTTELAKQNNVQDIQFYGARNNAYVPTVRAPRGSVKLVQVLENSEVRFNIYSASTEDKLRVMKIESENEVLLNFSANKCTIQPEDMKNIILPKIDRRKKIYFSGRIPSWLASTLVMSYDNPNKAIFQTGTGFITFASESEMDLGKKESSPTEIDFEYVMEQCKDFFQGTDR